MSENLNELPRQDKDQAAVMFDRSEYNDPSTYINYTDKYNEEGKSFVIPSDFVTSSECVMNEKDLVTFNVRTLSEPHTELEAELELYPGDRVKVKVDYPCKSFAGRFITITGKSKSGNRFYGYSCQEDAFLWKINELDMTTLIRANKAESPVILHPGDKVRIKESSLTSYKGELITIKSEVEDVKNNYYCQENNCFWSIAELDLSTLVKAEDVKSKPNNDTTEISYSLCVGDIVEWGTSKKVKYVCLLVTGLDSLQPHNYFKSGNVNYVVNRIKRIVYRLGQNFDYSSAIPEDSKPVLLEDSKPASKAHPGGYYYV